MSINIKTHGYDVTRNTSYGRSPIKYIVMHYTATNGATAKNEVMYFSTNPSAVYSSADFFVDDNEIWQYNTQLETRYSWAVGDGSGGSYGNVCWNGNQISIEMSCYQNGGQWFISDKTYHNAVELVKYLMKKYNVTADRVIRHYDVSRKLCPGVNGWIGYFGSESTWKKFKIAISNSTTVSTTNTTVSSKTNTTNKTKISTTTTTTTNTSNLYRIRKTWSDSKSQIGAYKNLDSAKSVVDKNKGYYVFDSKGNIVYPKITSTNSFKPYVVKITADVLNVRKGAGISYAVVTTVKQNEVYTIVDEKNGWGLLKAYKSGRNGWISLAYTQKR